MQFDLKEVTVMAKDNESFGELGSIDFEPAPFGDEEFPLSNLEKMRISVAAKKAANIEHAKLAIQHLPLPKQETPIRLAYSWLMTSASFRRFCKSHIIPLKRGSILVKTGQQTIGDTIAGSKINRPEDLALAIIECFRAKHRNGDAVLAAMAKSKPKWCVEVPSLMSNGRQRQKSGKPLTWEFSGFLSFMNQRKLTKEEQTSVIIMFAHALASPDLKQKLKDDRQNHYEVAWQRLAEQKLGSASRNAMKRRVKVVKGGVGRLLSGTDK